MFGLERSDLKMLSFRVDAEYEGYEEEGVYRRQFAGYKFRHILKGEFESDNERLRKTLYMLANCPLNPEIRISYTVKDSEATKNELLGRAVIDAKEKATVLMQAAGVMLKEIQSMDYSCGKMDIEVWPMRSFLIEKDYRMALNDCDDSYDPDIEPDDIEVTDTVTVVWKIG